MKKIYYILPIVLLVMNVLSGCTDSEEEQGPVVVEVDDEEMVRQGWKWAVALTMTCGCSALQILSTEGMSCR